jgi:hypothetical protein
LIAESDVFLGCQINHVISEKHGGPTNAENLAYACVFCNRAKRSDIGSIHWETGEFVRFFNPRVDSWADHFSLDDCRIVPLTTIGEVTARILQFNNAERLLERQELRVFGQFPSASARTRMHSS